MPGGDRGADRRAVGAGGEAAVADWYVERGYAVVARNWRCRQGELDLVLMSGHTLVFCEVKTRTSDTYGAPAEAVTRQKQLRIRRLAAQWMQQVGLQGAGQRPPSEIRFDVAAVLAGRIEVVEGAF